MAGAESAPGVVVPQPLPWRRRLAAFLAAALLRLCIKTWHIRWLDSGACPGINCGGGWFTTAQNRPTSRIAFKNAS